MDFLIRLIERITGSVGAIAALIVLPLIVATCYEVFARYIFNAPTIWAYELGYMATGAHFLLGAALTLARGGHIRIDLVYAKLSPKARAAVDITCYLLLLLPFTLLLSDALWGYALSALRSGEGSGQSAWNPPIWPFRLVFFLGFAMLALQVVAEILKCIQTLRSPAARPREA